MKLAEPSHDYDVWEAKQEEAYQRLIKDKMCQECMNCNIPGKEFKNDEHIGWCEECSEFICFDDFVEDIGCEDFYGC